jgi:hypothetical protein
MGGFITLTMEAASMCETSVNFHQSTLRYNPEDSHLHTDRRENLNLCFFLRTQSHVSNPTK